MGIKLKLDTTLKAQPDRALEPHTQRFYDSPAYTVLVVGELRQSEFTNKTIDGGEVVKVRLITAHPVTGAAEDHVRKATRAAFYANNIGGEVHEGGHLFADGQAVDLDPSALPHLAGRWGFEEFARLRVGVEYWLEALRKVGALNPERTAGSRYRDDIRLIIAGLEAAVKGAPQPDAPDAPEWHAITADVEDIPAQDAVRDDGDDIVDATIYCGAVLEVTGPGELEGFTVTCDLADHEYGTDHRGTGFDRRVYEWPNPAPDTVPDEPGVDDDPRAVQ
jgi:hypothetical protein